MALKPRVLFLNRSYFPDAEATGQLLTQLCEELALQFDVRVITGQPNSNPSAAPFVRVGQEDRNGVVVRRVWHTQFSKSSTLGRLVNWGTYLLMATLAALCGRRPDIIVVETDPPLLCLVGAFLRWRFGCQHVVYLQDIYPDLGVALGRIRDGWVTRLLRRLFLAVYRRADQVVVLSDDMRQVLIQGGVDPAHVVKIPNWVDCAKVQPFKGPNTFREELGLQDQFVVMHSGNLGYCQRLENLLEAAERLKDRTEIVIVLVGDGAFRRELEVTAAKKGLTNVRFVDYQPASRLSESLSAADLHIVSVDPRVVGYLMPSKLYGVLASGTPLIAIAPNYCELALLVERNAVGWVVEPDDPQTLSQRIAESAQLPYDLRQMGERARKLAVDQFDRSASVDAFATLLIDLFERAEGSKSNARAARPIETVPEVAPTAPLPESDPTDIAERAAHK